MSLRRVAPLLAVLAFAPNVLAQGEPAIAPPPKLLSDAQVTLWHRGPTRPFVATNVDVGYLYLRPTLSLGYGRPFWRYVALDLTPVATNNYLAAYGGLRFAIPFADLRVGARGVRALYHNKLDVRDSYDAIDLNMSTGEKARYLALEAEVNAALPLGPGSILGLFSATRIANLGEFYVYEEQLRVISGKTIWRARGGYAIRIGREDTANVGLVGEVLGLPERSMTVLRGGAIGTFAISEHLDAVLTIVLPIISRDSIGLAGGDIADFGLRYRWATGQESGL